MMGAHVGVGPEFVHEVESSQYWGLLLGSFLKLSAGVCIEIIGRGVH